MIFSGRTKMTENCNGHLSKTKNQNQILFFQNPSFALGNHSSCTAHRLVSQETADQRFTSLDFLGSAVDKNPPDIAGDMDSISGLGRFYMPCICVHVCMRTHTHSCQTLLSSFPPSLPPSSVIHWLFTSILFSHF